MPSTENKEPKAVRWRETELSEPQGMDGVRHTMTRVVEGTEPPKGAATTTDEPHDWRVTEAKEND